MIFYKGDYIELREPVSYCADVKYMALHDVDETAEYVTVAPVNGGAHQVARVADMKNTTINYRWDGDQLVPV
jgi:hypothetical protein